MDTQPADEIASLRQQLARLQAQAQSISVWLSEAGCSAMPIDAGVRWLLQQRDLARQVRQQLAAERIRAEAAEQERDEAGQILCEAHPALWTGDRRLPQVARDFVAEAKRTEAALAAERAKRDEADAIFKWLSGEEGEFPDRPDGAGLYWWRTELRRRVTAWRAKEEQ